MAPASKEKISDAAVKKATGCTWERWYKALDDFGARKLDHRGIVALVGKLSPRTSGWWQQMVTVSYEQARGLRQKHQKPEGFEVSASKTVAAPLAKLYRAWTDAALRRRWLGAARFHVRKATSNKSMRITWADDSRVSVNFYAKGAGKSQVAVQHGHLPSAAAGKKMQAWWRAQLEKLPRAVGAGG